ncbi:McrC family protein [Propionicicella superfundia]|uniref:McrC family protein n=1 Tax=Propionicicella superfundia TaxID=348582 RepID=UPI00048E5BA0|nr:hypothetical protein [Propionicicella superfundia]
MPDETLVCQLAEYQQIEVELTDSAARRLQAAAGTRLALSPGPHGYLIRASSYVGSISVPGIVLHIVPKVPVANVLYLMAWSTERIAFSQSEIGQATGSLTAAVATWYARMLERSLVLGVDRAYVEETDRVIALRGRIDWPAQAKAVSLPTPIACRYDDWSIDTRPNRIAAAAALALLRNPAVPPQSAFTLRRLLKLLAGVGPLRPDDLSGHTDVLTRLNEHYRSTVQLARIILRAGGPSQGAGRTAVSSFMINMNDVFEDFVFASLKHQLRGTWGIDKHKVPLDVAHRVPTEPDLLFADQSGTNVLVADSKYKLISAGRGRNADYYQLLAYCTSLGLPRGVLIYCDAGDEPRPPHSIEVRQSGTVLDTFQVGLSGSFDDIADEFDRLARYLRFGH